jgi:hypothetical protein
VRPASALRRALPCLALGALVLAGASCSGLPCRFGARVEFVSLGRNPFATAQPTADGRRLHTLVGWRGELYMGYGDYEENTGPIEISAYNPRLASFGSKLRFPTEAIELYRPIGARLYAPAIDPLGDGPLAAVAVGEADGTWTNNRAVFVTHAFDIATLDGADLWLAGSRRARALVVRSMDGGRTWGTALEVPPRSARDGDFARFHFIVVHGGRIYVQAQDYVGGVFPRSQLWDGTGWRDGPDLLPIANTGAKPYPIAGRVAYLGARGLMAFDGHEARVVRTPAARILDLTLAGRTLYVLDGREVVATEDLARWTPVATAPPRARSIGVLDGYLYAGTADSELYRYCRALRP